MKRQYINILLPTVLVLLLAACTGDNSDLQKYINDTKNRPAKKIEPIPQFAPLPVFEFPVSDNRRNPFKPVEQKKNTDQYAPDQKRMKQPLEAFSLETLRFVGHLKQGSQLWALIRQPDKKITRVRVGNYMGQNYGRIILIKSDEIKLEETIKNAGKWEKITTTINLDTSTGK